MTTPIVDVHCHNFNADDLPVRGFVQHVAMHDFPAGSTLAQLVDALIQHGAPGFDVEKARLDSLLGKDEIESTFEMAIAPAGANAVARLEGEVDVAMVELQARNPGLLLRAGRDLQIAESSDGALTSENTLESFPDVLGAARRAVRWVKLFAMSRLDVTEILLTTYRDVDLFCPMLVDLGASLGDAPKTTVHQQVILQEKISRLSMTEQLPWGGRARIHPFVGFDPRHEVRARLARDVQTPLDVVKEAVATYGFVGVKVYPPMGYRPINNTPVGDMTASEATAVDEALRDLYAWCQEEQVPVTAHCNDSNYSYESYQKAGTASPDGWIDVLQAYPDLHLNLGHFGGARHEEAADGWPWKIARATSHYPHLFADVANHDVYDDNLSQEYLGLLQRMSEDAGTKEMKKRLMYGSDWFMVAIHPDHEQFLDTYRRLYEQQFGPEAGSAFMGDTALRFLGFDDPTNANNCRLRARYEQYAPEHIPDWLA